jgi:competence protein ComEA
MRLPFSGPGMMLECRAGDAKGGFYMKQILCACLAVTLCFAWVVYAGEKPATPAASASAAKATLTDINSATKEELMKLPGIGDALSAKIIQGRPYRSKDELVRKKIIPQATYDKVKGMIIAKQN